MKTINKRAASALPARAGARFGLNLMLAATLLALAPASHALNLSQAWQAAEQHDRELAVARAAQGSAEPQRAQADALWRPNVALNATAGVGATDTTMRGAQFSAPGMGSISGADFSTSIHGGAATRIALQASQPLIDPGRRAQQAQLRLQADQSELQWQAAHQGAMLRVAQLYLDVALAAQQQRVLQGRLQAVGDATAEAQERFTLGAAPVTALREAQAQLAQLKADAQVAQTALEIRQRALADATGLPAATISAQLPAQAPAETRSLDTWQQTAQMHSTALHQAQLSVALAQAELQQYAAGRSATLALIAQASHDRLDGRGDFGRARNTSLNAMVGVQLTVPLSSGGLRDAREQQAAAQLATAQAQLDAVQEQLARDVHAAWLAVQSGAQQASALDAALTASRLRLDATRTGHEVGERTLLDVLNAQSATASVDLQLAQARSQALLAQLRLAGLAGQLGAAELRQADALLMPDPSKQ